MMVFQAYELLLWNLIEKKEPLGKYKAFKTYT